MPKVKSSSDKERGKRIEQAMIQYGYNNVRLADHIGKSSARVGHYLQGGSFNLETAIRICETLDLSLDYLAYGNEYGRVSPGDDIPHLREQIDRLLTIKYQSDKVMESQENLIRIKDETLKNLKASVLKELLFHRTLAVLELNGKRKYEFICCNTQSKLGYTSSEIVGKDFKFLYSTKADKGDVAKAVKAFKNKEIHIGKVLCESKDGREFLLRYIQLPLRHGNGDLYKFVQLANFITID